VERLPEIERGDSINGRFSRASGSPCRRGLHREVRHLEKVTLALWTAKSEAVDAIKGDKFFLTPFFGYIFDVILRGIDNEYGFQYRNIMFVYYCFLSCFGIKVFFHYSSNGT
jgi:hypothetical protein